MVEDDCQTLTVFWVPLPQESGDMRVRLENYGQPSASANVIKG